MTQWFKVPRRKSEKRKTPKIDGTAREQHNHRGEGGGGAWVKTACNNFNQATQYTKVM